MCSPLSEPDVTSGSCRKANTVLFKSFTDAKVSNSTQGRWGGGGFTRELFEAAHSRDQLLPKTTLCELIKNFVRFEVLTAVTMKHVVFWDIKPQFVLHRRHFTSLLQSPAG
jgi:hypothetical protein